MKKKFISFFVMFTLIATGLLAQDSWTQKANFGGGNRYATFHFSIGDKGYVGTGYDGVTTYVYKSDFWEFDPVTGVWTQKADFAGGRRVYATGFSIGNKGYAGLGTAAYYDWRKDMWEYDPAYNTWRQLADFAGGFRQLMVGFAIGNKGYMGTGNYQSQGGPSLDYNDFWEYEPATDTWTQKSNIPGVGRYGAIGMSIGNKGYIGTGYTNGSSIKDFWEYDPVTDSWTRKTDFGGTERVGAAAFTLGDKGYVGTGWNNSGCDDLWEYTPSNDSWLQKATFPGGVRNVGAFFSIGNKGYIGLGGNSVGALSDFYEYTPTNFNGDWTQLADFPTGWRYGAVAAGVGNKGYLALGASEAGYQKDMWEFDPDTKIWTQKEDFPGTERQAGVAFAIGYKVYVGTGINMYTAYNDFYSFDPAQNLWTRIADYPGGVRYAAMAFSIGNKGYLGCGKDQNFYSGNKDFYEYDPTSDAWTRKADVGTIMRSTGVGFSVGNKGYIGMGYEGYDSGLKDLWEFDPNNGTDGSWTQKPDLPAETRALGVAFSIGNKGYIVAGLWGVNLNDLWSYEPSTSTWKEERIFSTAGRGQGIGFVVGNSGYFGLGYNYGNQLADLWKFTPPVPCDTWAQLPDFPGVKRAGASAFSIGNKGYIAVGSGPTGLLNDTWEFDPQVKYWTQKADFPGTPRHAAFSFTIGSKGYVGTGINMYTAYSDFYEFNPTQNAWTQKADYPGGARYIAMAFSIGNKGYAGCGKDQGLTYGTSDFYEYDPATNMWTRKADVGTVRRSIGVGFSIGNRGYIGLGAEDYDIRKKDMWEFNPAGGQYGEGSWTQKNDFAGQERHAAVAFTIGNRAYIGSGYYYSNLNDMYAYDPVTDTYEPINTFNTLGRGQAVAFSIGNKGYLGSGADQVDYMNSFWEYNACYVPVKPTLSCVEDRIVFSTAESCSQIVNDLDPTILPDGAAVIVNYSISRNGEIVSSGIGSVSGLTFLQGVNSVTYSLPDYPGQNCSFTVNVVDTIPPVLVSPPTQTICYNTSNNYTIPTLTVTDNCSITSITYIITGATTRSGVGVNASGLFNPGRNTILWTVTDNAGNSSTCTTNIRVDFPLAVSIPNVYPLPIWGKVNTIYKGFGPTCAILSASPSGGTQYPYSRYKYQWSTGAITQFINVCPGTVGLNMYTVTITDSLGCKATASIGINVVDVRCGPNNNEVLVCWFGRYQNCYKQGQAIAALLLGAKLGSCNSNLIASANKSIGNLEDVIVSMDKEIELYPNPNNGSFTLRLHNLDVSEIRISDQSGRIVYKKLINGINNSKTIAINPGLLARGIYMVQAIYKNGISTCKMIVQ